MLLSLQRLFFSPESWVVICCFLHYSISLWSFKTACCYPGNSLLHLTSMSDLHCQCTLPDFTHKTVMDVNFLYDDVLAQKLGSIWLCGLFFIEHTMCALLQIRNLRASKVQVMGSSSGTTSTCRTSTLVSKVNLIILISQYIVKNYFNKDLENLLRLFLLA